jgi:UDP-N-acetylglucosamine 2-epimerase (non-hydrolysing)
MKKILLAIGTRPEAIKMCPLIPALRDAGLAPILAISGQHRELLWNALALFGVSPDHDLSPDTRDGGLAAFAGGLLSRFGELTERLLPDAVLVHGDTVTALAAAEAAFLSRIPVGHVEAGLRTGNLCAPFPEEHARVQIDRFAKWLYAPTEQARQNLLAEGRADADIFVTGNTGVDALRHLYRPSFSHPALDFARGRRLILFTLHRRESHGEPLSRMLCALRRLCEENEDVCAFFPCHPNPAVRDEAVRILQGTKRLLLSDATDARTFQNLLARAYFVMTDSGGVQEEAPYFGVPVLVLRERTEREEGVRAGVLRVVGTEPDAILAAANELLHNPAAYAQMAKRHTPFGDGYAAPRIAAHLAAALA